MLQNPSFHQVEEIDLSGNFIPVIPYFFTKCNPQVLKEIVLDSNSLSECDKIIYESQNIDHLIKFAHC